MCRNDEIYVESENYQLKGHDEYVRLFDKTLKKVVTSVGNHYGNPDAFLISRNEKFVVTGGYGIEVTLIDFFQKEPKYVWSEFFREKDNEWFIDDLFQIDSDPDDVFRFQCRNDQYDIAEYSFNTKSHELQLTKIIESIA